MTKFRNGFVALIIVALMTLAVVSPAVAQGPTESDQASQNEAKAGCSGGY